MFKKIIGSNNKIILIIQGTMKIKIIKIKNKKMMKNK